MERLIADLLRAIDAEAWHAALALSLALPDICGYVDSPGKASGARYSEWFDQHLAAIYRGGPGASKQFLSGDDCYALRCAYLHQGEFDITDQRARQALTKFRFVVPPPSFTIHRNLVDDVLQLQVSEFAMDMIQAVEKWLPSVAADADKAGRLASLAKIEIAEPGKAFVV